MENRDVQEDKFDPLGKKVMFEPEIPEKNKLMDNKSYKALRMKILMHFI